MYLTTLAALAQGFDSTGPNLPPVGGDARSALTAFGARPVGVPTLTVTGEGATGLLVREVTEGPFAARDPVVESVSGINLGGRYPLGKRFSIAAALPTWVGTASETGSRPALGDLHIWAPLIATYDNDRGGIAVVPFVRLPTGARQRYLGDPIGAGATVSASFDAGPLALNTDLGLSVGPGTQEEDWPGGPGFRFAGSAGFVPGERFGVHAELRSWAPFGQLSSIPSEVMVSARGRPANRFWIFGGAGAALTRGIGAASTRISFGVQVAFGDDSETPQFETKNVEMRDVLVLDSDGIAIDEAVIRWGRGEAVTDLDGYAQVPVKDFLRANIVTVAHPRYKPANMVEFDKDAEYFEIRMERRPIQLDVSVVGDDGRPNKLSIVRLIPASGSGSAPEGRFDNLGVHHWRLPPGTKWVATIEAPKMGGQGRVIDIPVDRNDPIRVDVVLQPAEDPTTKLTINVVDGNGLPVEGADVVVEGRSVGSTGTDGTLEIKGLARGEHVVSVRSPEHGETTLPKVVVGDATQLTAELEWPRGAVVVKAIDEVEKPVNAEITMVGPRGFPPRRIGPRGEKLMVLGEGRWRVQVQQPGYLPQERIVDVDRTTGMRRMVDVVMLQAKELGPTGIRVRVSDGRGKPLPDVAVQVDYKKLGTTGPDGSLMVWGLLAGEHRIDVKIGEKRITETLDLGGGTTVVPMSVRWDPGLLDVEVDLPERPPGLQITAETPDGKKEVFPLGPDGKAQIALGPGLWTVSCQVPDVGYLYKVVKVLRDAPAMSITLEPEEYASPEAPPTGVNVVLEGDDPPDALMTFYRSRRTARTAIVAKGEANIDLEPGKYTAIFTPKGQRPRMVAFEVKAGAMTEVKLPAEAPAETALAVENTMGEPMADVEVFVDTTSLGKTNGDGVAAVKLPADGKVRLEPPIGHIPAEAPVKAVAGRAVVIREAARPVAVTVAGAQTNKVQVSVPALGVKAEGGNEHQLTLRPGRWTIMAREEGQIGSATVTVTPTGDLTPVEIQMQAPACTISEDGAIDIGRPVLFDADSDEVREASKPNLDLLARCIRDDRSLALVQIGGHADDNGGTDINQDLSERRARAVGAALIKRGVEPERLLYRGYGRSRPLAPGTDEDSRLTNRRVELTVVESN